jgi:Lon protease-like protein
MTPHYSADTLPATIPVFPLAGALVLPRGELPLNIFEPRYLAMVRDAMNGDRLIGMVQPKHGLGDAAGAADADDTDRPELYAVGGLGRITQFSETGDGRFLITLVGLTRFRIAEELVVETPYRQVRADYAPFAADWREAADALPPAVRADLEASLHAYLDTQGLSADWDAVATADDEALINTLTAVCPFDVAEKQALLEATTLRDRAGVLSALMTFAAPADDNQVTLH